MAKSEVGSNMAQTDSKWSLIVISIDISISTKMADAGHLVYRTGVKNNRVLATNMTDDW